MWGTTSPASRSTATARSSTSTSITTISSAARPSTPISRIVRRLFSLTDVFDSWKTGERIGDRSRAFSLQNVTLYTSLESCAQCSGVMSLGGVKQVVYLQNDFTAYMIGNIMFNLSNPVAGLPGRPSRSRHRPSD